MDRKLVDALTLKAKRMGAHIFRWQLQEDWTDYVESEELEWSIPVAGEIHFKRKSGFAAIAFKGISPVDIDECILGEPILLNKKTIDAAHFDIVNESKNLTVERSYEFDVTDETNYAEDIGVTVAVGLTQKITAGGEAAFFKSETEISLDIETAYSKQTGGSHSESRKTTTTLSVPPRTKATITTERSLSTFEQADKFVSGLEHSVEVWAHGNYHHVWKSCGELKDVLLGKGTDATPLALHYRNAPSSKEDACWRILSTKVDFELKHSFDKATTGNVRIKEEALD